MATATTMIRFGHPYDSTLRPKILLLWLHQLFAIFCIIIAVSSSSFLSSIVSTTFAFELMPTTTTTTTFPHIIETRRKLALRQQRQRHHQNGDKSFLKLKTSLKLKNNDDDDDDRGESDDHSNRNSQKLIIQQQKQQQQDNAVDPKKKKELLVDKFVSYLLDALKSESFVSLALFGISNNDKNNNNKISKENLRGSIRQVQGRHIQVKNTDLLQLTIKYHGATDICKNLRFDELESTIPQILLNPRKSAALLAVSSEWGIESMVKNPICRAELITTSNVWELQLSNSNNNNNNNNCNNHQAASSSSSSLKKRRHKTKLSTLSTTSTSHDRTKNVPISTKSDFLFSLGVTKADGKPKPGMKSKLRQCQKFVEIVGNLVEKVVVVNDDDKKRHQQQSSSTTSISVVDMGCGRGYLTFALHQYLSDKYSNKNNNNQVIKDVYSKGIDVRPKLVAEISKISNSLGGSFQTLTFEQGTIEDIVQEAALNSAVKSTSSSLVDIGKDSSEHSSDDDASSSSSLLQVLIALHACDTATDDALWSGICRSVDIIVVAPCCHKQVRPQIDQLYITASKKQKSKQQQHPLVDVLKHGIYRERFAETVTDSLRALLLELAGYKVQVFEFIGGEHTSKNVMITAVKNNNNQKNNNGNDDDTTTKKATIRQRIHTLCKFHGIQNQKLADWMGLDLMKMTSVVDDDDDDQEEWMTSIPAANTNRSTNAKKSARLVQLQMPAPRGQ